MKMNIKTLGVIPAAVLLAGGINLPHAQKPNAADKNSGRPSREAIVKRFDRDRDGRLNNEEGQAARKAMASRERRKSDEGNKRTERRGQTRGGSPQGDHAQDRGEIKRDQAARAGGRGSSRQGNERTERRGQTRGGSPQGNRVRGRGEHGRGDQASGRVSNRKGGEKAGCIRRGGQLGDRGNRGENRRRNNRRGDR